MVKIGNCELVIHVVFVAVRWNHFVPHVSNRIFQKLKWTIAQMLNHAPQFSSLYQFWKLIWKLLCNWYWVVVINVYVYSKRGTFVTVFLINYTATGGKTCEEYDIYKTLFQTIKYSFIHINNKFRLFKG